MLSVSAGVNVSDKLITNQISMIKVPVGTSNSKMSNYDNAFLTV